MGFFESSYNAMTSGAVSGALTRFLIQPLDVIKVRMQLQVERISAVDGSKYTSATQALNKIVSEEGVTALWKGHVPAQVLSILYCAVQFPVFEALRRRHMADFTCGGIAGVTATVVCLPVDVLRTRFIGQGSEKVVYSNIPDAVRKILRTDGPRGFFRGLLPSCFLIFPQTALQFHSYFYLKAAASNLHSPLLVNAAAGLGAGLISKTAVYPLDLIKKRMQVQGFEEARRPFGKLHLCSGLRSCVLTILGEEGPLGFYKGFLPSLLKAGCVSALTFGFYEAGRGRF